MKKIKSPLQAIKVITSVVLIACFMVAFTACNKNNSYENIPEPPLVEEILPSSIEIELYQNWAWEVKRQTMIKKITVLPENATNKSITWSSSNAAIAWVAGTTNDIIYSGKVGITNITATTINGIQTSFDFEIKSFITDLPKMPFVFQDGFSNRYSTYQVNDMKFSYYYRTSDYSYAEKIVFKFSGTKISDMLGNNNATSSSLTVKLYDKDTNLVDSSTLFFTALVVGDHFKDKEVFFYDVPESGAPYSVTLVQ